MSSWPVLDKSVHAAIQAGKIGQPVFVRCFVEVPQVSPTDVEELIASLTVMIEAWMGAEPDRLHAAGTPAGVSAVLHFRNGATAVLGTVSSGGGDLIVLGNRGAMYFEALNAPSRPFLLAAVSGAARNLLRNAVARSIETGKPQAVPRERQ